MRLLALGAGMAFVFAWGTGAAALTAAHMLLRALAPLALR